MITSRRQFEYLYNAAFILAQERAAISHPAQAQGHKKRVG